MFTIPVFGVFPDVADGRLHDRVHDDGRRPEHRRRLRGPARPRLRRLLRDRRLHGRLVRLGAVRGQKCTDLALSAPSSIDSGRSVSRHPPLDLPRAAARRRHHRALRDPDRPADAAAARRLPRDRDARLRRDLCRRSRATATTLGGFNLTNGPNGITPIDSPGFGNHLSNSTGGFLPANYLTCCNANVPRPPDPVDRPLLLDRDRAARLHGLLLAAAARLAARPRLDRDPRGRDRRGRDGHPADADEDLGLRERRVLRRRRRRVLRRRQGARPSPTTSSSTSRSSSSAWSSSAAWATSGA